MKPNPHFELNNLLKQKSKCKEITTVVNRIIYFFISFIGN